MKTKTFYFFRYTGSIRLHLPFLFIFLIFLIISCEKENGLNSEFENQRGPTAEEVVLKSKLDQAAYLLSVVLADTEAYNEILQFANRERRTPEISFNQILQDELKTSKDGTTLKFSKLREALKNTSQSIKSSGYNTIFDDDLLEFLMENDCGIWAPFPFDSYPSDIGFVTVTGHPIDESIPSSPGYIYTKSDTRIIVDEEYVANYPVLVITPNYIDFEYPILVDDENDYSVNLQNEPVNKDHEVVTLRRIKLKTVWNTIFWTRYFDIYVMRGEGSYNPANNTLTGTFPTVIHIRLPRDYALNEKWYPVNIEWDSKWNKEKTRQIVGAYRYKSGEKYTIKGSVGFKKDPISAEISASAEIQVTGRSLGNNEWNRDWFYETNNSEPLYVGNRIRSTSNVFDMTFSISQY